MMVEGLNQPGYDTPLTSEHVGLPSRTKNPLGESFVPGSQGLR